MVVADPKVDVFGMTAQERSDFQKDMNTPEKPDELETPEVEDTLCSGQEVESEAGNDDCLMKGGVDPDKCAVELSKDDDCFLYGTKVRHGKNEGETCLQCLLKRAGIEHSGCTLVLLKAWCEYGYEDAPENVQAEEKSASPAGLIKMFENSHAGDIKTIQKKLHKQMSVFADLLAKFDSEHPSFTDDESTIMLALLGGGDDSVSSKFGGPASGEDDNTYKDEGQNFHEAVQEKVNEKTRAEWTKNGKAFMKFLAKKRAMPQKGLEAMDSFSPVEYGLQSP